MSGAPDLGGILGSIIPGLGTALGGLGGKGKSDFQSGYQAPPANGQYPIYPQQNYWQGGNFYMPGQSSPIMTSGLQQRFPQLSAMFGGQTPNVQTQSGAPTAAGGMPPQPPPATPPKPPGFGKGPGGMPQQGQMPPWLSQLKGQFGSDPTAWIQQLKSMVRPQMSGQQQPPMQ